MLEFLLSLLKGNTVDPKPVLQSKTLWVNAVVILLAALTGVMNCDVLTLYPSVIPWIAGIIGVVNIALRLVTSVPVK